MEFARLELKTDELFKIHFESSQEHGCQNSICVQGTWWRSRERTRLPLEGSGFESCYNVQFFH